MVRTALKQEPLLKMHKGLDPGYVVLVLAAVILGSFMAAHGGFEVRSDGSNYFAYLRSAVFDRDLNFQNEFARFDQAFWDTYKPKTTPTGHLTNVFSVGPALLWAPFYLLAHLLVILANLRGAGIEANGFTVPYIFAVNLASLFYTFAGMCLVYRLCRQYCSLLPSLAAAATLWLGSFITYYNVFQPYMSHSVSFFSVTLFIYCWQATRFGRTTFQWCLLGLTTGLMMLVRWQNGLFMIIPAIEAMGLYIGFLKTGDRQGLLGLWKKNALFLLCAAIGFFPQMAAWKILYGSFLTVPQGTGFLRWSAPFVSEILFSSRHGLFSWTPAAYIASMGWLVFYRKDRLFFLGGTAAFVLMTYVNSVVVDWWAGWGFGMRRFDGLLIILALGLACAWERLRQFFPRTAVMLCLCVPVMLSSYNWFLMDKVDRRIIHPGGPVAFNRVLGLKDDGIYRFTGYPFSVPANLLFSVKYGISPARYDTLVGGYIDDSHFYGDTINLAQDSALLGSGWSEPLKLRGRTCRLGTDSSLIYTPVRTVTGFEAVLTLAAANQDRLSLAVVLNGQQAGVLDLDPQWREYRLILPSGLFRKGINTMEFKRQTASGQAALEKVTFRRTETIEDWR